MKIINFKPLKRLGNGKIAISNYMARKGLKKPIIAILLKSL